MSSKKYKLLYFILPLLAVTFIMQILYYNLAIIFWNEDHSSIITNAWLVKPSTRALDNEISKNIIKKDANKRTGLLVDTPGCQIIDWPVFDPDVLKIFEIQKNFRLNCTINHTMIVQVKRVNFTGIIVEKLTNKSVKCVSMGVRRVKGSDNGTHYANHREIQINKVNYFDNEIAVKVNCSTKQGIFLVILS